MKSYQKLWFGITVNVKSLGEASEEEFAKTSKTLARMVTERLLHLREDWLKKKHDG